MLYLADVLFFPSTVQLQCREHELLTWEASTGNALIKWAEYAAFVVIVRQTRRVMAIAIWWGAPKAKQKKALN